MVNLGVSFLTFTAFLSSTGNILSQMNLINGTVHDNTALLHLLPYHQNNHLLVSILITLAVLFLFIQIIIMNMRADEGAIDPQEPKWLYDVFLTFRGEDTRFRFGGNLYNALHLKGIKTFMDYEGGLSRGDEIRASLFKALEESRISIVVLSQHYGASRWYLDQLVKIMECRKTKGQLVVPIFYQVDPSDVRHQRRSYEKAMAKHESKLGKDSERVKTWRKALSEIANVSGWDSRVWKGYEYEFIDKIVEEVIKKVPRYDVFLSFSGQDTRYSFTGYLCNALNREGFQTFMNYEVLEDGAQISESVVKAIEISRISIIVFSENYAYSASRLDELVMILECMKKKNQLVWPIFYKVEPSDLRHQINSYGKAMIAHENMFGKDSEKVQKWRLALSQVANLKGWHLKIGYEYQFIERIVVVTIMNLRAGEGAVVPQEPKWRYDVYLSFRGEDARRAFAGNLCNALRLKGIKTFMNDDRLNSGDQIAASVLNALEESRISMVILSENYAFSSWRLDELAMITECRKTKGQLVVPIFYHVHPSHVRNWYGSYGDAMAKHKGRFGKDSEKVKIWSTALRDISNLSGGWYFGFGYEYELIQRIVDSTIQSLSSHDVFLSFSGEDTRYSFTGFLYKALCREGLKAFMDDEGLVSGNEISQALISAIEKSRLSIVVFSENYGYSSWCLDELANIIECMKTKNQLVLPIFYKVEQSDVSNQTKSYGDAMAAHEKRFGKDSKKVQKWRSALSEIANMKGEHLNENEYEYELIQRIVEMAIDFENHQNHQQIPIPSPCSEVN